LPLAGWRSQMEPEYLERMIGLPTDFVSDRIAPAFKLRGLQNTVPTIAGISWNV